MESMGSGSPAALKVLVQGLNLAEAGVALSVLDAQNGVVGNPRLGGDLAKPALFGLQTGANLGKDVHD